MTKIAEWDWKYRIAFDINLRNSIKNKCESLEQAYAEIYKEIIDFYENLFSIGSLVDSFEKYGVPSVSVIDLNVEGKHLVKMPDEFKQSTYDRISNLSLDDKTKNSLYILLDKSIKYGEDLNIETLIKFHLGKSYKEIIEHIKDRNVFSLVNKPCWINNIEDYISVWKKERIDSDLIEYFGDYELDNWIVVNKNTEGPIARWLDKDISGKETHELLIYQLDGVRQEVANMILFHEVYPGKGYFLNKLKCSEDFFDYGATFLIEGWSTYCEWEVTMGTESSVMVEIASSWLLNMNKSYDEKVILIEELLSKVYDEKTRKRRRWKISQYPGLIESHYFGAFWLDYMFETGKIDNPVEWLSFLNNKPKGDFLKIWRDILLN